MKNLTAVFEEAKEGGYVCWIEEVPEAISQGDSFEEARKNLLDALQLVFEYRHEQAEEQLRKLRSAKIKVTKEPISLTEIQS